MSHYLCVFCIKPICLLVTAHSTLCWDFHSFNIIKNYVYKRTPTPCLLFAVRSITQVNILSYDICWGLPFTSPASAMILGQKKEKASVY